jgi:hypothetical protein
MLKRILRRLAGPSQAEAGEVTRALARLSDAQRDHTQAVIGRLGQLSDLISRRATSKDANEILHTVREATALVARSLPDGASGKDDEIALIEFLDSIARGTRPIIIGPWTGEVGFELLYWVPFVEWFRERWRIDPERLVIVSRGGTASWYGIPKARYVDIFTVMSPTAFRDQTSHDEHKQRHVSPLDEAILAAVQERLGLEDAASFHPRRMYRVLAPFWNGDAGFALVDRFTTHRRIAAGDDPVCAGLPAEYVAARFYFSDAFPDTSANRGLAQRMVQTIAEQVPVVLLNPGLTIDDHADAASTASARIIGIADRLVPERNLAAQTAVIAGARAFVGTYGGYSYLAPLCGVPAVAFYSERDFKLHHLAAAQRVFGQLGDATVVAVDTRQIDVLRLVTESLGGEGARGQGGKG